MVAIENLLVSIDNNALLIIKNYINDFYIEALEFVLKEYYPSLNKTEQRDFRRGLYPKYMSDSEKYIKPLNQILSLIKSKKDEELTCLQIYLLNSVLMFYIEDDIDYCINDKNLRQQVLNSLKNYFLIENEEDDEINDIDSFVEEELLRIENPFNFIENTFYDDSYILLDDFYKEKDSLEMIKVLKCLDSKFSIL